jgi:hypothetical protein
MDEFPHFVGSEDLKEPDANSQSSPKPTNIIVYQANWQDAILNTLTLEWLKIKPLGSGGCNQMQAWCSRFKQARTWGHIRELKQGAGSEEAGWVLKGRVWGSGL